MKLISKFHDYYDTALAHGQDKEILYLRERGMTPGLLSEDLLPWEVRRSDGYWQGRALGADTVYVFDTKVYKPTPTWKEGLIPFSNHLPDNDSHCWRVGEAFSIVSGKAYPVWLRHGCGSVLDKVDGKHEKIGESDPVRLMEAMEKSLAGSGQSPEIQIRHMKRGDRDWRRYQQARERILAHDFTELHLQTQAPVLLVASIDLLYPSRSTQFPESLKKALATGGPGANAAIIINPRLADFGMERVLDPYSCFQAISQFIGGVIPGQQLPMTSISDASMVQKKGFDPKYGFRKRPAK